MRQKFSKRKAKGLLLFFVPSFLLSLFFTVCSFTAQKFADDFLKQLGINKQSADEKITNSIIAGYVDCYGVKNAKNIALGNRKAVTLDLLNYIKKYVSSSAFEKAYHDLRDRNKPKEEILQTPEEMQASQIALYKKNVADIEASIKNTADATVRKFFETSLEQAKKSLKDAEDPNNRYLASYRKNYSQSVRNFKDSHDRSIAGWNNAYPENPLLFVKKRLEEFLAATSNIDFSAGLSEKNGRKIFTNPEYERKDGRWKMAFRAGKEVVEPARDFVQKWIEEIK